jgi:ABC-type branched-subunit amino acid transport system substrate-binding protein
MCGAPQVVVAPLLERTHSLAVLGNSAPRRVFKDSHGRMLSSQPSIEQESTFNGEQLNRLGINSVVVILYDSDFSRSHDAAFKEAYRGKILDTLVHSAADQTEIRAFTLRVKQLNPEALYVPDGYPFMLGLMKELQQLGLQHLPVFSVYSAQSEDVLETSGAAAERIVYSYPDIGDNEALEYFPKLAATMLLKAANACAYDTTCTLDRLTKDNEFDEYGAMRGKLILKTVRNGNYVAFSPELEQQWQAERQGR